MTQVEVWTKAGDESGYDFQCRTAFCLGFNDVGSIRPQSHQSPLSGLDRGRVSNCPSSLSIILLEQLHKAHHNEP
jgi:hypothetical protein